MKSFIAFFSVYGTRIGVQCCFDEQGQLAYAFGSGFKLTGHKLSDFVGEGVDYTQAIQNFKAAGAQIQYE